MKLSERWQFNEVFYIGGKDDPLLKRRRLIRTPWFGIFLHTHERPDGDRDLHDHPWNFVTIILRGGYVESHAVINTFGDNIGPSRIRTWRLGSVHRMKFVRDAHRINSIRPGTLSLVFVGRTMRDWGFFAEDEIDGHTRWIPWQEYNSTIGTTWKTNKKRSM